MGVIRFKSSIGVQLTVTLSMVLLLFAILFAMFTTRHVQQFGDSFAEGAVHTLRHRVELNLTERVRQRALHYDHFFKKVSENSALLAEKARDLVFSDTHPATLCDPFPPLSPGPSGALMGSEALPVFIMRLPGGDTRVPLPADDRHACLFPYLEIFGHASMPTAASYVIYTNGLSQYYPNTVSREVFSAFSMDVIKGQRWFAAATPTENPTLSTVWTPVYKDDAMGGVVATASSPVVSKDGVFQGVAGIDLPLEGIFESLLHEDATSNDVEGTFWFLVDDRGIPLLLPEKALSLLGVADHEKGSDGGSLLASTLPGVRRYAHGVLSLNKGVGRMELGGRTWIISHHVLPSMGWVLGAAVPDDALFAGLEGTRTTYRQATRRMGWEIVMAAVLFTALALGLFYCVLRERLVRPLRMLERQARRVSRGDLDGKTVALSGSDEMARLALSFDQMIASLQEGRDFQDRTTDYLEAMVRTRTREVEEKARELNTAVTEWTTIFSNSMVGIMLLKGGRTLWKANDRMAEILGYDSPEEMEGLSMRELHVSEEAFRRYGAHHYDALVHGVRTQIDYRLKRRDGSVVWCSLSGKAVDAHVPPDLNKGVLWVVDDITERKVSEQAIRESEERFREMAELLPCIVCEVDLALRVTYVNSLGLEAFQIRPEDFQTPGIALEAFHPDDRQRVMGRVEITLAGGEVDPTEYRMINGDGEEIRVLFHSAPIIRNSAVVGIRASLADVTEYRALQETLLKQGKLDLIGSFIGGIAHDFNNMLAVLLGRVELAGLCLDEGAPARKHLATMEETLQRARDLVARLIALSTRGEEVEPTVPIQDVLRRCVKDAGGAASGVYLELSPDMPRVTVDGPQMGQAIDAVVKNALEACDGKGEVRIRCTCLEKGHKRASALGGASCLEVAVRDRGRGIAEEHLPHIFDPYYTTKERSSRKGMGFGLAVTHAVVTRHGGTLTVDSRLGEGTTVYLCLSLGGVKPEPVSEA
ncbi:PAS domain S-box protein [Desulfoluna spongiiphila]|uniref:PAS domain S-box protein n=1 Tax=Desulfoluna spongiiphila TaxID=419481 RepID=UPI001251D972|nr:PAS domain S-box protein [Desulfoluna spongiiphila]VVS93433.1 pas fold-3 [Desulfoluna spongiiphila]